MTRIEQIQHEVAYFFDVKPKDLRGLKRNPWYTLPRMVAMYLARKLTRASYAVIGSWFGGRDHSTVVQAVQKIERLRGEDESIRTAVATVESRLTALESA